MTKLYATLRIHRENHKPYEEKDYKGDFNLLKLQKEIMQKSLIKTKGSPERSAILMGVSSRSFYRWIIKHELQKFIKQVQNGEFQETNGRIHNESSKQN